MLAIFSYDVHEPFEGLIIDTSDSLVKCLLSFGVWVWLLVVMMMIVSEAAWYHDLNPHIGPFPYSHVITHLKVGTIVYEEPTIPPNLRIDPRIECCVIRTLCVHHKNMHVRSEDYTQQMYDIANT